MKLAYLLTRFPKASETFIERELEGLRAAGVDFVILPLRREPGTSLEGGGSALESRVHRVGGFAPGVLLDQLRFAVGRPGRYLGLWRGLPRYHRRVVHGSVRYLGRFLKTMHLARYCLDHGITHIHAHWATHPALSAYLIHRLTGIPFSFTGHALDLYVDQTFLAEKLRAATFVATCNEQNERFLRSIEPTANVHVVHHGLPLGRYPVKTDYRPGLRLFSAARLVPKKGLPDLLEALAELREAGHAVQCRIAGDGPERGPLEARSAELGLGDAVRFLGYLPHEGVIEEMRAANAVVLPSIPQPSGDRDGIPNVLIEALALGVPVVSTRFSGIPELVTEGEQGLLVPPGEPAALARALRTLGPDAELQQRMGRAGRRKIEQEFDLAKTSALLLRLFRGNRSESAIARGVGA
jgi:glycosyltransferase involved in cell wall biosynthesis